MKQWVYCHVHVMKPAVYMYACLDVNIVISSLDILWGRDISSLRIINQDEQYKDKHGWVAQVKNRLLHSTLCSLPPFAPTPYFRANTLHISLANLALTTIFAGSLVYSNVVLLLVTVWAALQKARVVLGVHFCIVTKAQGDRFGETHDMGTQPWVVLILLVLMWHDA